MPSAYILAKDHVEQARAILASEVWYDPAMDHLLDVALARLEALDASLADHPEPVPLPSDPGALPPKRRGRVMPWLVPESEFEPKPK